VLCSKGEIRGCFQCATGAGELVEDRIGWETVLEEFQPNVAADKGFFHEGHRPYASADYFHHPVGQASSPKDPTREQDLTPDCPRPRNPSPGATHIGQGPSASFFYSPPSWLISFTLIELSDLE
jgi:hypothetical protein